MNAEPDVLPHLARIELAAVPTAPGLARAFVRHALQRWHLGGLVENVELIASELVTNAVKATGISNPKPTYMDLRDLALVVIELQVDDGALRIAVKDSSREQPALQAVNDDAEGGRGLFLVEALSARWDVLLMANGKVTWAELALVQPSVHEPGYP